MTDTVVICTKDRPKNVTKLLQDISAQTHQPDLVLIIDASSTDAPLADWMAATDEPVALRVVSARAGLPHQRNVALQEVPDDIDLIHFLDDDVELDADYLKNMVTAFEEDPDLVGATGDVINAHPLKPHLIQRLLLLRSKVGGVVLASGANVGLPGEQAPQRVMWLPGCSMSFRKSAISNMRFDESREGYALGEDVDFTASLGINHKLGFVAGAKLTHFFATDGRPDFESFARDDVRNRWLLSEKLPYVKKAAVIYSTLGNAALYWVSSFQKGNAWQRRSAAIRVKTLWALIIGSTKD